MKPHDHFDGQNDPFEDAPERPSDTERAILSRRSFVAGCLAAVAGSLLGRSAEAAGRTSVIDKVRESPTFIKVNESIARLERAVQADGMMTIEHGVDSRNTSELVLKGRSVVQPRGYRVVPVSTSIQIDNNGRNAVLIPCPRNFIDMRHIGSQVWAYKGNNEVGVQSEIVYSEPDKNGNGYVNPFVFTKLTGTKLRGTITVNALHWVLYPDYPQVQEEYMQARMGPAWQNALNALGAGMAVPWTPQTDCGYKAKVARNNGNGLVDLVEGFSTRDPAVDANFGGRHCINLASSSLDQEAILTTFDARERNRYIGPLFGFIPTAVGGMYSVPDFHRDKLEFSNGGYYQQGKLTVGKQFMQTVLSTPTFGPLSRDLANMQPKASVSALAQALGQENTQKYEGGLALNP